MNIAIIFAGGKGTRMENASIPKQFLEIYGVPILIRTCRAFQNNNNIDKIVIITLKEWIEQTKDMLYQYKIDKAKHVIEGGETGQLSIYEGLKCVKKNYGDNNIVILNDGVRPFVNNELINENINAVIKYGSSVSIVKATETISIVDENGSIKSIPNRDNCVFMKAPQSFWLKNIIDCHEKALKENINNFTDSATMMNYYGYKLHTVETDYNNIKITTMKDIKIAESIFELQFLENK